MDKASLHESLIGAAETLSDEVDRITFALPVTQVYNPLQYAWSMHRQYIELSRPTCRVLFLGMNPGPWGMAQTGVPFGEVAVVRDWLKIKHAIQGNIPTHPKRPIEGLACTRSEVSGRRLWGLMAERFQTKSAFFKRHFVLNYCPLTFMEATGRNRTPDKLPANEQLQIQTACDRHLSTVLRSLRCEHLVGVGAYAETCLKRVAVLIDCQAKISRILHPSPASPAANRDWSGTVTRQLQAAGVYAQ